MLRSINSILSDEMVNQIISESLGILIDPGIRVDNQEALKLLNKIGARVDISNQIVSIPENIVYSALDTAPSEFHLYNTSGEPVVHYGGNSVQFDPGSTALTILDSDTGIQRSPITSDYVKFLKLVEALPQIDAHSTAMVCADVVKEVGDFYRLYIALCYLRKPIITGAFRKDTWWTMKEMLAAVCGGENNLRKYPIAVFDVCPSPPLLWSDLTCQNLIDCARSGIPAEMVSMPLSGATSPVTLAGAVVQHTAESLSGLVIHQAANPGAPIVWGGSPAAFDMREGTTPMGAAETWLIDAAYVQIGKSFNLPTHVYMGMSDSKVIDSQSGFESMGGTLVAALSGANMISGAGMLDFESCQSLEKLVIDAEIIDLTKRVIRGIEMREDPIALTLMREMGHRGDYLQHKHTRKWYRDEMLLPSKVIDRSSYESWKVRGGKTTFERAKERVDELINIDTEYSIDNEMRTELCRIATLAANQFGMEKLPELPE